MFADYQSPSDVERDDNPERDDRTSIRDEPEDDRSDKSKDN